MDQLDLYYKPWTYFWLIQSLGLFLFAAGIAYKVSFYRRAGKSSLHNTPDYLLMLKGFIRDVIFQKQLAEKSLIRWYAHMAIFYGFMGLLLLSAIAVALETVVPGNSALSSYMHNGQGRNYYKLAGDFFGLLILSGLGLAFLRRFIVRDSQLSTDSGDTIALTALLVLVVTGFLLEGVRIALGPVTPEIRYSFLGYALSGIFRGIQGLEPLASGLWAFHATLNAFLLVYIPHGKFLHIFNTPAEIMLNASEERMRGDLYL